MTSACVRRPGAASQAFELMHNTLSHGVKTSAPGIIGVLKVLDLATVT
jgi:hypothetical protein